MESRPKKSKTKRSLTRSFVVTVAVGVPSALIAGVGCSSTPPENAASPGASQPGTTHVANGKCDTEGAQQPCHVSLGKTGGGQFQSCFTGTSTCTGGLWSACGGDGTVTNSLVGPGLDLAPASAAQSGLHTLGVSGCGNGICGNALRCNGGSKDGNTCLTNADCPGGTCAVQLSCVGGSDNGDSCTKNSDCGGGGTCTGGTETCATCPQDCGPCAPGAADGGVSICTSDPCSADCLGWTQSVPISSAGGVGSTIVGVSGFGQINNGQIKKLLLDNANTGTKCDDFTTPGLPSSYYNCQVDTYCQMTQLGGDGDCHQFPLAGIQGTDLKSMGVNPGVDVTIGPGCSSSESDKYRYFPICNRGTLPVAAGTKILVKYYTPVQAFSPCPNTSCTPAAGWDCSMTVSAAGLLPGVCQLLDTQCPTCALGGGACSQPNGDKWLFANCNGGAPVGAVGVAEGSMTMKAGVSPVGVTGAPDNEPTTSPGILGCANNWTDHSPNNNPPACGVLGQNVITFQNDFHATCPTGTGPVWNKLVYNTSCPSNGSGTSEVFFEAATAPDVAGVPGVYSSYYEMAEAQKNNGGVAPGSDPEICSFTAPFSQSPLYGWATCSGPSSPNCCPKDIETQLQRAVAALPFPGAGTAPGAVLAGNPWLRMRITLKSTPDAKKDATLNSYSLSYQCVARE